jgi:hypothetical protein
MNIILVILKVDHGHLVILEQGIDLILVILKVDHGHLVILELGIDLPCVRPEL